MSDFRSGQGHHSVSGGGRGKSRSAVSLVLVRRAEDRPQFDSDPTHETAILPKIAALPRGAQASLHGHSTRRFDCGRTAVFQTVTRLSPSLKTKPPSAFQ